MVQIATCNYVSGSLILLETIETLGEDGVVLGGGFQGKNLVREKDGRFELHLEDETVSNLAQAVNHAAHCVPCWCHDLIRIQGPKSAEDFVVIFKDKKPADEKIQKKNCQQRTVQRRRPSFLF